MEKGKITKLLDSGGVWMPLLLAVVLVVGMLVGMRLQSASPAVMVQTAGETDGLLTGQGRLEELIRYIEAKYVDPVDRERLIRQAIERLLADLDPHSTYIPAEDLREINEQMEGNFDGIGVEFMLIDDTIVVIAPLAGGPAEAAGIMAGDKLVMIGDSTVAGKQLASRDITSLLRGEKGTQVEVGIRRGNRRELLRFTLTRDKIPMHSVDVAYMLDEQTGYIKINRFSATTYEEFAQALERLVEKEGMQDLVLDLRHNPGGYLQQATNLLSQLFVDKGKLMVYTEGRAVSRTDYVTSGRAFFPVQDVVVLIDEGSASASEIVAGAIQDSDRGVVIGRRSFGKGLVQEQYPLRDGSALRLTVARYYTPSGRSIQKPYDNDFAYEEDLDQRLASGELAGNGKVALPDSTRYFTANGHVVYGGGGIIPDIFVPIDTSLYNSDYLQLRQYLPNFVFRHLEAHRAEFDRYDRTRFQNQYRVDDNLLEEYLAYARRQGGPTTALNGHLRNDLRWALKARLGKQLFDDQMFYAIWNQQDKMILRALEVLGQPNPLAAARKL